MTAATADVVVCGGGNAGLCAAIAARRASANVVLLERAPAFMRGGNTRHTRDIRLAHAAPNAAATGAYPEEELYADLLRVTEGETDEPLARLTFASHHAGGWMSEQGVRWQKPLTGTLHLSRTNGFFLGGGKHLVEHVLRYCAAAGRARRLRRDGAGARHDGVRVGAVVYADASGEQRWRARRSSSRPAASRPTSAGCASTGATPRRVHDRGTPYNTGVALKAMYEAGAQPAGDPRGLHCVAVDARAPRFDGGIVTRIDAIPFGIAVNAAGERFYDEGEELWPKRYAIWGKLIAEQPGQIAYAMFDQAPARFIPSAFRPVRADDRASWPRGSASTAPRWRARWRRSTPRCGPRGPVDLGALDGNATDGLDAAEVELGAAHRHAAVLTAIRCGPASRSPISASRSMRCARRCARGGEPFENVFAAGECMAGNILSRGYLAGFGLTIGSVFGRIAGRGRRSLLELDLTADLGRQLDVCNACRYCEGFCADVRRGATARAGRRPADFAYLANLCHDCRMCFDACMFTPPHEFAINIPAAMAARAR